jgi:hypothetical protein
MLAGNFLVLREEWRPSRQGKKVERRHCGIGDRGAAGFGQGQAIVSANGCVSRNGDDKENRRTRHERHDEARLTGEIVTLSLKAKEPPADRGAGQPPRARTEPSVCRERAEA